MNPYYEDGPVTLYHGDCIEVMRTLPDASVDAVVTDPPYALEFMGKGWDRFTPAEFEAWCAEWATECLRVLKPGGHLLAFGGSRTWHRLQAGVEDAGFEIRDSVAWLYGSGFPKSLDVSKAIDKAAGAEREVVKEGTRGANRPYVSGQSQGKSYRFGGDASTTAPATDAARDWEGWGTALKPAHEPVVVARKPVGMSEVWARIGSQIEALEDWCRQRVSDAGPSSARTRRDSLAARTDSARASAATPHADAPGRATATGEAEGSSAQTDTSSSEWTVEKFWNTVTSWKACWAELSGAMSTYTTSTATSRTTDLRTLSSSMSSLTRSVMAQSTPEPASWSSLASAVDNQFAAGVLNWRATLALSAHETATGSTRTSSPDEDVTPSRPAFEPIVVARKPLGGSVAANVLAYGTGALNIDATRVEASGRRKIESVGRTDPGTLYGSGLDGSRAAGVTDEGRWPTNVVLDESQAAELDRQSGVSTSRVGKPRSASSGAGWGMTATGSEYDDEGGASRFFPTFRYEAKAPTSERPKDGDTLHPTVKPLALMQWLVRLVTPPVGVVLEPFAGSGTTVEACLREGFGCVAIEREADYLPLILQRIQKPHEVSLFDDFGGDAA